MEKSNGSSRQDIWAVLPVYNNKDTVAAVARDCLNHVPHVLVVDDGSTDADIPVLFAGTGIHVCRHETNRGKGAAILTALAFVKARGGRFMITIDADGQHYPRDLEKFIPLIRSEADVIVVGCRSFDAETIPVGSRFGRRFANFWLMVETGVYVDDCQSGFRAYPVDTLDRMRFRSARYDFESEVLARAAWAGLKLKTVAIDVWYPEPHLRVSGFKPFRDNVRISLMHARLVGRRLVPWPHRKLTPPEKHRMDLTLLWHPVRLLKMLLRENATPAGLAVSAAVGTFLAVLPLLFVHTLVILYVATRLHLNKIMALNIQHLCMPPVVPMLCIEVGYFMRNGCWLTDVGMETIVHQAPDRLWEWFLGSLVVAPAASVLIGAVVYGICASLRKGFAK